MKRKVLYHLLLICILTSCSATTLKRGDTPPDLLGETVNGDKIHLSELRGKIVLLTFWATWCPWCKKDLPNLVALQQTYQSNKFVSFAVNTGEPPGIVSTYVKNTIPDLSVLVDPQGAIYLSFGGSGVPFKILINESGQIHWVGSGYSSPEKVQLLKQEIETLLGGNQ